MIKKLAIGGAVAAIFASSAFPVFAAKPNNQACLGKDFSGYAQGGAVFGGFIAGLASSTTGVGAEFQAHLAGEVPDVVIPNSCND